MNATAEPASRAGRSGPALGGAWWVLLLAGAFVAAATVWRVHDMLGARGSHAVGDGRHPETYGFALTPCLVPRGDLAACGLPRDGLPVLDDPPLFTVAQADSLARGRQGKYLVAGDRVIGVELRGRARAYPLRVLNWHEIVNDTLGGRAIAVTYSPLCDAAVVFDREVRGAGLVSFGHSGLLYNSDLLMYDRREGHAGESLWSQLAARAVTGPAAAESLRLAIVPSALARWGDWKSGHPSTSVLARDPARAERYNRDPYSNYYGSDELRFPVHPLPPRDQMPWKTPCLALRGSASWRLFPLPLIRSRAGERGIWRTSWDGRDLAIACSDDPLSASLAADGPEDAAAPAAIHCFWFAWYATHPGPYEVAR